MNSSHSNSLFCVVALTACAAQQDDSTPMCFGGEACSCIGGQVLGVCMLVVLGVVLAIGIGICCCCWCCCGGGGSNVSITQPAPQPALQQPYAKM